MTGSQNPASDCVDLWQNCVDLYHLDAYTGSKKVVISNVLSTVLNLLLIFVYFFSGLVNRLYFYATFCKIYLIFNFKIKNIQN